MTGATTPCPAQSVSQALPCSAYPDLQTIAEQTWSEAASRPDPRLRAPLPQSLAARLQVLAPAESGLTTFLEELECLLRSQRAARETFDEDQHEDIDADIPVALAPIGAPQAHVQALVRDFSRRQRQATMFVTGCVAASCVLTVIGIAALASLAPQAGKSEDRLHDGSNATAWAPAPDAPLLTLAQANPNRSGKSDSLFVLARHTANGPARGLEDAGAARRISAPELVLMQPDRPVSLAPLIAPRQASYVLIRGLPDAATLSAGERSPSGAWLVKAESVGSLTLTINGTASGDYSAEIYAVGAKALPQGRQRVVFRVEPALGRVAAESFNWAMTLRDMALTNMPDRAVDADAVAPDAGGLIDEKDPASAGAAYERISETGAAASGRMKILASLSD